MILPNPHTATLEWDLSKNWVDRAQERQRGFGMSERVLNSGVAHSISNCRKSALYMAFSEWPSESPLVLRLTQGILT